MKLRNIIYSALAVSALTLTSCSDSYLDEKMYSSYGTDVEDVNAKVIGLHYKFAALWGWSDQQGFTGCWQTLRYSMVPRWVRSSSLYERR